MFVRNQRGVYQSSALLAFDWLDHGFGSRHSDDWLDGRVQATLRQVHSDIIFATDGAAGCAGQGDALISRHPGLTLVVRTADCLPLLFVDPRQRAIAAVHAGWRGTVAQIAPKTVQKLHTTYGTKPKDLWVAIGPGIGACCYEVGPEVAEQFGHSGQVRLDLADANLRQLAAAGVPSSQILHGAPCTFCTGDSFHSYRRDREKAGRMLSGIVVREE